MSFGDGTIFSVATDRTDFGTVGGTYNSAANGINSSWQVWAISDNDPLRQ